MKTGLSLEATLKVRAVNEYRSIFIGTVSLLKRLNKMPFGVAKREIFFHFMLYKYFEFSVAP